MYIKIAYKYIKKYSRRSMAIVLSIALSTFLIVTIGSLSESSRIIEINEFKKVCGVQHVRYDDLNMNQVNKIKKNKHVKKVAYTAYYDGFNYENQLSVDILLAEENILYMETTKMSEGRFPTNSNEIAIEGWVLDRLKIPSEINQKIKVHLQEGGETEFKLVGIIRDRVDKKRTGWLEAFVAFNDENLVNRENNIYAFVEFKEDLKLKNEIKQLAKEIGIKDKKDIVVNKMLLNSMGQLDRIDWRLIKTSIMLMVVGGMVIYSIYGISVLKRIQEYGNLRAIGTTTRQLIYIILSEIGIIYIMGIVLGILLGIPSLYLLKGSTINVFTEGAYKLDIIVISVFAIKLAMSVSFGAISLAGIRAILLTIRLSPIEATRKNTQDHTIYMNKKESIIEKILGIPNKIAYKHLKRNKKAMIFTIVSMSIGCTLFMVQAFEYELFTRDWDYRKSIDLSKQCEFQLNVNEGTPMKIGYTKEQIKDMKKNPQVKDIATKQLLYAKMKINKEALNGLNGKNYIKYMNEKGFLRQLGSFSFKGDDPNEIIIRNTVLGLSDDDLISFNKALDKGKINVNNMKDKPLAVIYLPAVNEKGLFYDDSEKSIFKPILNINIGDTMKISIPRKGYHDLVDNKRLLKEHAKYKEQYIDEEFTIIGITSELPDADVFYSGTDKAPYVLISENMFKEFSGIDTYRIVSVDMEDGNKEDYKILKEKVENMAELIPGTCLQDRADYFEERKKFQITYELLQNSIVIVLILISGLSIYNNISYNLISRLREHGVMKAIGLTKKQFRKMIRFEGLMYGSISAIFSCIVALIIEIGLYIYYAYYKDWLLLKQFFIQGNPYLIAISINIAIGYMATLGPIRQVDKIEITEAIKSVE